MPKHYVGGIVIATPSKEPGQYVVRETNIRDRRLIVGHVITSADISDLVNHGAKVLIQRKGELE